MLSLLQEAEACGLAPWAEELRTLFERKRALFHSDLKGKKYLEMLSSLPDVKASSCDFDRACVRIGEERDLSPEQRQILLAALRKLLPWRKGPWRLFGVDIDSEWVSWRKWDRLQEQIQPLAGRKILDIGSSNGYYMFRMAASRPALVLGIEPYLTFYFQYRLLNRYAALPNLFCLPAKLDEMPAIKSYFDTVFCMGVLYHHRAPHEALRRIRELLRPGGELVLETLILPGEEDIALSPRRRYAKMGNIYFIPTVSCLKNWLHRAAFGNLRCISIEPTTATEQRRTDWIDTESLADFLDPQDPSRTVEGYPAPVRAIVLAQKR